MVGFKRLDELGKTLTARTTKAHLKREEAGRKKIKTLVVQLEKNPEIMTNSDERKEHRNHVDQKWFEKQCNDFKKSGKKTQIAGKIHPLEVITGDVSLALKIEDKEYYLLFYRDIHPPGWINPGGCPSSIKDLKKPKNVPSRECGEEVCILRKKGTYYTAYSLCSSEEEWRTNHQKWLESKKNIIPKKIIQLSPKKLPCEKGDAQKLVMKKDGGQYVTKKDIDIYIDPQFASVTVTEHWEVILKDVKMNELMLFDGEDGNEINRPVGLFTKEEIEQDRPPTIVFVSGQNIILEPVKWSNQVVKKQILVS